MENVRIFNALELAFLIVSMTGSACADAGTSTRSDVVLSSEVEKVWAGTSQEGYEIPSQGSRNGLLRKLFGTTLEKYGSQVNYSSLTSGPAFVSGRASQFGGSSDHDVQSGEKAALTGERLRSLNTSRYYAAMRFNYGSSANQGVRFWKHSKLLIVNPSTGNAVVVQPIDWGPNLHTGRIIDLSPGALRALGIGTDGHVWVSFADPSVDLGPVR